MAEDRRPFRGATGHSIPIGWLQPLKKEEGKTKLVQAPQGEWISYEIKCVGDHLQVWVNGQQTTDYKDDVDATGHIGVQHHGERGQVYRFRNIRIREIASEKPAESVEPATAER